MKHLLLSVLFLVSCETADVPYYVTFGSGPGTTSETFEGTHQTSVDTEETDDWIWIEDTGSTSDFSTISTVDTGSDSEAGSAVSGSATETEDTWPHETEQEMTSTEVETVETDSVPEPDTETEEETQGTEDQTVETEEDTIDTTDFLDTFDSDTGSGSEYVDTVSEFDSGDTDPEEDTGTGIDTNPDTNWVTDPDTGDPICPLNDAMFDGLSDTCWFLGEGDESCLDVCSRFNGEYSIRTSSYVGSIGIADHGFEAMIACRDMLKWFDVDRKGKDPNELGSNDTHLGCYFFTSQETSYIGLSSTTPEARDPEARRLCACVVY